MAQKQNWVSLTGGDFRATLDNLKGLVTESREPQKDIEQVVGEIKKTVQEAHGRETYVGLQRFHEALTILDTVADHFEADGLKADAADVRALRQQLIAVKERMETEG